MVEHVRVCVRACVCVCVCVCERERVRILSQGTCLLQGPMGLPL